MAPDRAVPCQPWSVQSNEPWSTTTEARQPRRAARPNGGRDGLAAVQRKLITVPGAPGRPDATTSLPRRHRQPALTVEHQLDALVARSPDFEHDHAGTPTLFGPWFPDLFQQGHGNGGEKLPDQHVSRWCRPERTSAHCPGAGSTRYCAIPLFFQGERPTGHHRDNVRPRLKATPWSRGTAQRQWPVAPRLPSPKDGRLRRRSSSARWTKASLTRPRSSPSATTGRYQRHLRLSTWRRVPRSRRPPVVGSTNDSPTARSPGRGRAHLERKRQQFEGQGI